ncbi:MAG: chloride channel protein [Candidatus Heimdallarchaeota archaeon]|nr:chloride channel protein [Candidatus Heimdallarchaeota archaeon]
MNDDSKEYEKEKIKISRFKIQFRKYWKYTRKWFPFSLLMGMISGVLMGLFTSLIVNLQIWLDIIPVYIRYPVVGGITSLILYFGFKEVRGAGISYVLKHKNTTTAIPARVILTKFFTSALTLGVAAPAGREGPSVTIGSAVAFTLADKLKMNKDDEMHAVTIGAAACTSAVFRTPLGGTVFAAEVPYKHDLDETVFLPALVASAVALLVSEGILLLLNSFPVYLDVESVSAPFQFVDALVYVLLGIIAGFSGIMFSLLFKNFSNWIAKMIKPFLMPFIGMVLTTILVLIFENFLPEGMTLGGTGFHSINFLLENYQDITIGVLFLLFAGKMVVTSTCVGFGASGGVMGPSLVTGAALGALYSKLFPFLNPIALIIIGMSAFHTATTKTPIASMLIVLEMVGFPDLVIPIILSNAAAFIISMDFSLYSGQIESKEVILRRKIQYTDLLETLTVKDTKKIDYPTVNQNALLEESFPLLHQYKLSSLIVEDDNKDLVGIISMKDFQNGLSKNKTYIYEMMTKNVITVTEDDNLSTVFDKLTSNNIECIPVVNRDKPRTVVGLITYRDIEDHYEKALTKLHSTRDLTIEELEDDI